MQLKCASYNPYRAVYANVAAKYIAFIKKNDIVARAWNAETIGMEGKAKKLYVSAVQYLGLLNLLYILEVRKRMYEECWNTLLSESELECLIASWRCAGVDIRPLLKEFEIDPDNIICAHIPCTGEGLGNTGIEDPECPFKIYPNQPCNNGGIGNMQIEGIECPFKIYPN